MNLPIACGSDAGSFMVPPAEGCSIEENYLKQAAGPKLTEKLKEILEQGNKKIQKQF